MSSHLRRHFGNQSSRPSPRPVRTRLAVQSLEDRLAPAIFNVINDLDTGAGSLRQAILDANAATTADTINFDSTFFSTSRTILLQTQLPTVTGSALTINGPGADKVNVRRDPALPDTTPFRIFALGNTANLSGMTISGGLVTGTTRPSNLGIGGRTGGGVWIGNAQSATIANCVITGNSSSGAAGGVYVERNGSLTIRNSTVSGNTAGTDPLALYRTGGGVYFRSGGTLLMENTTVTGNSASEGCGGVYTYGNTTLMTGTIRNSTITGNTAPQAAGVQLAVSGTATLNHSLLIQNSTIVNNTATTTTAGTGGGGVGRTGAGNGLITITSSIVANNTVGVGGEGPDVFGPVTTSHSLIRDQSGSTITDDGTSLAAGTDPMLDAAGLANNGGPTQTIALQATSTLINAGSNPSSQTYDQRGPGFPRSVGQTDIGAYEFLPPGTPVASGTFAPITTTGVATYSFQVTYTDGDGTINTGSLDNNDIRVTGPGGFNALATRGTFDATNPAAVIVNYSVAAPGAAFLPSNNGAYTISIEPSQVTDNLGNFVPAGPLGAFQVLVPTTFTVTNTDDSGAGSLRDAIDQANALNTPDTIAFGSLFNTAQTITLTTGELLVTDAVTISGTGASLLTVRRDPGAATQFRIFEINVPGGAFDVTISGLTITGGNPTGVSGTGVDGDGGGILMYNENVTLDGCIVRDNVTGTEGGGIAIATRTNPNNGGGFLTVRNSTISGNTSNGAPSATSTFGGGGGGIYFANAGQFLIENSTISGNTSTNFQGGAIYFYGIVFANGVTIRNSTISGNTAGTNAGGIYFGAITGSMLIQNSTIANNTAAATGAGLGGGGIAFFGTTGSLALTNSVVANNTNANAPDVLTEAATTVTGSFSLVRDQTGGTINDAGNNLSAGTNPLFAAAGLTNNGGPTETIALQSGSPLINAGPTTVPNLQFDQRGSPFVRVSGAASDIGAFEVQPAAQPPTVTATAVNGNAAPQRSRVTSVAVTFSAVVTFATTPGAAFTLTRNGGGPVTFAATANTVGGVTVVTLDNFTGAEAESGSLRDGRYTLTALANQISAGGAQMAANFTFGDAQGLFRYYGDVTGDRRVDIADFGFFSLAYLTPANYNPVLDFNNDTRIDIADFGQFSIRYFTSLP